MTGARLGGQPFVEPFPRPSVKPLVAVAALAHDPLQRFRVLDPLQRGRA